MLIGQINDAPAREQFLAPHLEDAGFVNTVLGFQMRRTKSMMVAVNPAEDVEDEDSSDIQESA
jgi:hypothetical protein